jgi:hypothetical protein
VGRRIEAVDDPVLAALAAGGPEDLFAEIPGKAFAAPLIPTRNSS